MTVGFPYGGGAGESVPSYYGHAVWNTAGKKRNGIHIQGVDTVSIPLNKVTGATACTVYDPDGNIVSSTSLAGTETTVTPTVPGGGWLCAWYRAVGTGPNNHATFGHTYWVTNFQVVTNDNRFQANPDGATVAGGVDYLVDNITEGVLGVGAARLQIDFANNPYFWESNITSELGSANDAQTYYINPAVGTDAARPRTQNVSFPNLAVDTLALPSTGLATYVTAYCKDGTIDGSKVYVAIAAGTSSGAKITVSYPNSATVVETYDNLVDSNDAIAKINNLVASRSAYIRVFNTQTTTTPGTQAAVAIARLYLYANTAGGNLRSFGQLYNIHTTADPANLYVAFAHGSVSGSKITVYYPNASTVVETYDNLADGAAAQSAINGVSAYIKLTGGDSTAVTTQVRAATPVNFGNFIGVKTATAALYPTATVFEGPVNEPSFGSTDGPENAHQVLLFGAAVKAGNASATVSSPSPVNIGPNLVGWVSYLNARGADNSDETAFHAYGEQGRDMNADRRTIAAFKALYDGYTTKPLRQSESTQAMVMPYGIHHPHEAAVELRQRLLLEEFGVVKERNNPWYGVSHGFWGFPAWGINGDGSLQPQYAMERTLTAEVYGQTYQSRLRFGPEYCLLDNMFNGWLYAGASKQTCVIVTTSAMPGSTVTLRTNAAGPLTVVDAWNNTSTVTVSGGLAVIPVREIPTYVRLPVGATCTVATAAPEGVAIGAPLLWTDMAVAGRATATLDGVAANTLAGGWTVLKSTGAPPSTGILSWASAQQVRYVPIWGDYPWSLSSAMLTFSVDTSSDGGSNYTTRASKDVSSLATAIAVASDSSNVGCKWDCYWPKQWIFFVDLGATYSINRLRVSCSATSYGGEPTAAIQSDGGQGDNAQHLTLQRIGALGPVAAGPPAVMQAHTYGNH